VLNLIEIAGYIDYIESETKFHLKFLLSAHYDWPGIERTNSIIIFQIKEKPYLKLKFIISRNYKKARKSEIKCIIVDNNRWVLSADMEKTNYNSLINKILIL
jgi:hypothetical protein